MSESQQRFEAAFLRLIGATPEAPLFNRASSFMLDKDESGEYEFRQTRAAWQYWQAEGRLPK